MGQGRSRSSASRSLVRKPRWGQSPAWSRAGKPRGTAGAAAAGARGAEDQEPRAREERAQPGWGDAADANFSHRGSGEERRGPGPEAAVQGSQLAGCEGQALRTPTPSKLGRGGGGPWRREAGGGRLPGLGWCRAQIRTERAAATRGWSRTEVAGGAGAGERRGRKGGRCRGSERRVPLPSCAARGWLRGLDEPPTLPLGSPAPPPPAPRLRALCAPAAAWLCAEPECPSRGGGQRSGHCVGDFLFLFYCFYQSLWLFLSFLNPPLWSFSVWRIGMSWLLLLVSASWHLDLTLGTVCVPASAENDVIKISRVCDVCVCSLRDFFHQLSLLDSFLDLLKYSMYLNPILLYFVDYTLGFLKRLHTH